MEKYEHNQVGTDEMKMAEDLLCANHFQYCGIQVCEHREHNVQIDVDGNVASSPIRAGNTLFGFFSRL